MILNRQISKRQCTKPAPFSERTLPGIGLRVLGCWTRLSIAQELWLSRKYPTHSFEGALENTQPPVSLISSHQRRKKTCTYHPPLPHHSGTSPPQSQSLLSSGCSWCCPTVASGPWRHHQHSSPSLAETWHFWSRNVREEWEKSEAESVLEASLRETEMLSAVCAMVTTEGRKGSPALAWLASQVQANSIWGPSPAWWQCQQTSTHSHVGWSPRAPSATPQHSLSPLLYPPSHPPSTYSHAWE